MADTGALTGAINAYDEYGVPQAAPSGPFGYTGALYLAEAGAAPWNMRNRQYHPTLGRFLQTDPIGYQGGINLDAYVGADPVNLADPWGLQEGEIDPVVVTCRLIPDCRRILERAERVARFQLDTALRRLTNEMAGSGRDAFQRQFSELVCSPVADAVTNFNVSNARDDANRRQTDGFYYSRQAVSAVVAGGWSISFGAGIQVRDGAEVGTYRYVGYTVAGGFNLSASSGILYSRVSPLGPATMANIGLPVAEVGLVNSGRQTGPYSGGDYGASPTPFSATVERGANYEIECPS